MPHRIIYCALSCATLLTPLSHEVLRKFDQGIVASVSDETIGKLLIKEPQLPIMYFSREAYEQAIRGLNDSEIDEVMHKRISRWSPQALDQALEWIALRERRSLSFTARSLPTATDHNTRLLQIHFDHGLDLLTSIAAPGRYDDMELNDLLSVTVELEALLIKELPQSNESQTRLHFANAIARELKRHGRSEFSIALPYAEPQRGVWVGPAGPTLKEYFKTRWIGVADWRDGLVASLPLRAIQDFRQGGRKVEILYADASALMQDFDELTGTQLFRRFEELSAAGDAARKRQMDDYLNVLRITLAVQRRALRQRAVKKDPAMVSLLNQQVLTETKILVEQLGASGSWLSPGDETGSLQKLQVVEQELTNDAAFLLSIAQQRKHTYLVERLQEILRTKQQDLKRTTEIRD
ncbi:MAG TPA: hypothetical protein VN844_22640 [Pyrinomonadaceae bacterium]|nr:hypothetical protein [Pyrinomonadaceae bacterium]